MIKQLLAAVALANSVNAAGVSFDYVCGTNCDNINDVWANAHPDCKVKADGEQSPIDLKGGAAGSWDMDVDVKWEKYTNQANVAYDKGANGIVGSLDAGEMKLVFHSGAEASFTPLQVHVHAPSEHTINGKNMGLEMHFVHKYKDTEADLGAVLGVFFDTEYQHDEADKN